jgi:hypothetical protein
MSQKDFDGQIQVIVHARPRLVEFIQIGLVVGMQEALQSLKLGLVAHRDAYDGLVAASEKD